MKRVSMLAVALALLTAFASSLALTGAAQTDMTGEWAVTFTSPQGPLEITMYVDQQGQRLTGHLSGEYGEFPLRGTIDGAAFTITWSFPDGGRSLEVTFTGKVEGDSLSGTAKLGTRGSGALSGTRTGQ